MSEAGDEDGIPKRLYQMWLDGGYFHKSADDADNTTYKNEPYTIVMPPPNVTGALHLGHALNNTLQDVLIRYKRMQGYQTLWIPGTDHAGIATQAKIEARIFEQESLTRHDLGREGLVQRIWGWKEQYEERILNQLRAMGCSCDWDRTRFTLDDGCAKAVRHTFFDLFRKNLLYRGKKLVNWDTFLCTTVSDDEVENVTTDGKFWHIYYPVIDPEPGEPTHVSIATTRPETMLGDTAVAVHPDPRAAFEKFRSELETKWCNNALDTDKDDIEKEIKALDKRKTEMLPKLEQLREMASNGRKIMLPLLNREIPFITDTWAKPELGSGCVKITPAHDFNDYEVGKRSDLPMINILAPDGKLNVEGGPYEGLTMPEARKRIVKDLDALGLLEKVEDRIIQLPISDRSKTPIEPMLSEQWFIRMDTLVQSAIDAVEDGGVKILPSQPYKTKYLQWLEEKRDWPVSRQLWWGHQIPVWSKSCDTDAECATMTKKVRSLETYSEDAVSIQIEPCPETDENKRKKLELPLFTIHVCLKSEVTGSIEDELTALGFVREVDVLDTWFSSALWPHSTLGWPEQTTDLCNCYPTSTLITSRDIISLWVARMVLMGLNNTGKVPFREVFIHPKILDAYGATMSKSRGNGIDPLEVIRKFGADSLRFAMADLTTTNTQDVRFPADYQCPHCDAIVPQTLGNQSSPRINCPDCKQWFGTQWAESDADLDLPRGSVLSKRFELARNFGTKLWNVARFAMLHMGNFQPDSIAAHPLTVEDKWVLSRLFTVCSDVTSDLEQYRFGEATRILYKFAWDELCNFYIDFLKERLDDDQRRPQAQRMLAYSLDCLLRMLHPFMPFITEEIWLKLNHFAPARGFLSAEKPSSCLIAAKWPSIDPEFQNSEIESQFEMFRATVGAIREIRDSQNTPKRTEIEFVICCDENTKALLAPLAPFFRTLDTRANLRAIGPDAEVPAIRATRALPQQVIIHVDLAGLIDVGAEIRKLRKELTNVNARIESQETKLSNENFLLRAPREIVEREQEKHARLVEESQTLQQALSSLGA